MEITTEADREALLRGGPPQSFQILDMPYELRRRVYGHYFNLNIPAEGVELPGHRYRPPRALIRVAGQLGQESWLVLRRIQEDYWSNAPFYVNVRKPTHTSLREAQLDVQNRRRSTAWNHLLQRLQARRTFAFRLLGLSHKDAAEGCCIRVIVQVVAEREVQWTMFHEGTDGELLRLTTPEHNEMERNFRRCVQQFAKYQGLTYFRWRAPNFLDVGACEQAMWGYRDYLLDRGRWDETAGLLRGRLRLDE